MQFAYPLAAWTALLIAAVAILLALVTYSRLPVHVSSTRAAILIACRAAALLLLFLLIFRPLRFLPPGERRDSVVPIVVDLSRSMQLADVYGERRLERAQELIRSLQGPIGRDYQVEVLGFGDQLQPADPKRMEATARRSHLLAALRSVRDRYRGRAVAGIVLLSDGGDTGGPTADTAGAQLEGVPPVLAIGIGNPVIERDREIIGLTAGEGRVSDSAITLSASAVSHGFGNAPLELRVLANGRVVDVRRVDPVSDGSPVRATFTVAPDPASPTLYTVEVPSESGEIAGENNRRSVLVSPPGRRRRVLFVEGAPGFEHSFLRRAWLLDSGLELDSVVRKGRNENGAPTFFVQAPAERNTALVTGFPATRKALFAYDALVFGNVVWDYLSRQQLALVADFISERGGGALVFGGQSFEQRSLVGTPFEAALPVDLTDPRAGVMPAASAPHDAAKPEVNHVSLTREGMEHPVMQLGSTPEEAQKRWSSLPALSASSPLGAARAGASILAVTTAIGGEVRPLVAVQRYGRGRTMIFGGEASWRWRMLLPMTDPSYEQFWRQALRWLAQDAPDPVEIAPVDGVLDGETASVEVTVRDADFLPARDATVMLRVTAPGGDTQEIKTTLAETASGRYVAPVRFAHAGAYHLTAEASRRGVSVGSADRWVLIGGSDSELADPRLNEEVLRRIAATTGGQYVGDADAARVVPLLARARAAQIAPEPLDIWQNGWVLGTLLGLFVLEWSLRRGGGMR